MSTTDISQLPDAPAVSRAKSASTFNATTSTYSILAPIASLRLTVVLFALSIVLVLAGTLAQVDHDIWYVIHNYFRCWIAWIDLSVFFPRSWEVPGTFPFPGGWMIGALLGANLLAAHSIRFKVTATGSRLKLGVALMAAGILLTFLVVQSGLGTTVESELSPAFCRGLWHAIRFLLGAISLGSAYWLALNYQKMAHSANAWLWWLGATTSALLIALSVWLFINPEAQLDPSGLRILWQLVKSTGAGAVLLAGCHYLFGQRAGIVLLHGGIALMMFNELFVGMQAEEAHMRLVEGQTLSYAEDTRFVEMLVVDKSDPKQDNLTIIPGWMLQQAFDSETPIQIASLPFRLNVVQYLDNAEVRNMQPGEKNPATSGYGKIYIADAEAAATGVGEQTVDVPAAYVEVDAPDGKDKSGPVLLLSPFMTSINSYLAEPIEVDGKPFEVSMRFRRLEKEYSVTLVDFERQTYVGSNTNKSFKSVVRLRDSAKNVEFQRPLWMNNPLRYEGDTLYQAGFNPNADNYTELQVVSNAGWMIPYVACMIVGLGMLVHFVSVMLRFLRRQERDAERLFASEAGEVVSDPSNAIDFRKPEFWIPAAVVLLMALFLMGRARPVLNDPDQMNIHEFGKLPVAYGGRVQPMDTLARNTLQSIAGKQSLGKEMPAIKWFLDTISDSDAWRDHRVFRIENLDVLSLLDLNHREGFRYSFNEIGKNARVFDKQVQQARLALKDAEKTGQDITLTQQRFLDLRRKIDSVISLMDAFAAPRITGETRPEIIDSIQRSQARVQHLDQFVARPVPPAEPNKPWQTVMSAGLAGIYNQFPSIAPPGDWEFNEAARKLLELLNLYQDVEIEKFNSQLSEYQKLVQDRAAGEEEFVAQLDDPIGLKPAERLNLTRVDFEAYFNHLMPFYLAMVLYVFAFVLVAFSWLGWSTVLNRSAHWLLWFTFAFHTFALLCRIYISGRPPVTNLYSSAVFIGWAAVLFALVFERIYRFGIGNLLATLIGFPTLFIAHNLAADGDTFQVLQAVLDTQFWLTTHVICITLGYSTTFLAGTLAIIYLLGTHLLNKLSQDQQQQLIRMIYGTVCFSLLFSFIGTVLGGLWADDSWGRFWGWDPKENGALIIVIWNALVLHARWGAMIRQTGLAVLAVFGNVVTAWSWFGVNQLGVGLHAYGFTEGRDRMLIYFVISQLMVMALGAMPKAEASSTKEMAA